MGRDRHHAYARGRLRDLYAGVATPWRERCQEIFKNVAPSVYIVEEIDEHVLWISEPVCEKMDLPGGGFHAFAMPDGCELRNIRTLRGETRGTKSIGNRSVAALRIAVAMANFAQPVAVVDQFAKL